MNEVRTGRRHDRRVELLRSTLAGLDPDVLAERLEHVGAERRWFRPIGFVGVAMLGLAGAVVTLVRNWRLVFVEIVPAVWIGAITWQWRRVVVFGDELPAVAGWAAAGVAALVFVATAAAYWCNVTFAFTVGQPPPLSIGRAFAQAQTRARLIWTAVVVMATLHTVVVVWVVRTDVVWFAVALGAVALAQMYLLVAIPVAIVTGRIRGRRRTTSVRVRSAAASFGVSGVTSTPGLLLNRIGVLLIGLGVLRWVGFVIVAAATVLQIAGVSSATAVKLAGRLHDHDATS